MLPTSKETNREPEVRQDPFEEPRDHANQWDVSALLEKEERQPAKTPPGPVVE